MGWENKDLGYTPIDLDLKYPTYTFHYSSMYLGMYSVEVATMLVLSVV